MFATVFRFIFQETRSRTDAEHRRWVIAAIVATAVLSVILVLSAVAYSFSNEVHRFKKRTPTILRYERHRPPQALYNCTTASCQRFRELFLLHLNHSIDTCVDLHGFSCTSGLVPRRRQTLRGALEEQAAQALFSNVSTSPSTSSTAVAKAAALYQTCVGDKTDSDTRLLRDFLRGNGLWPASESLEPVDVLLKMATRYRTGVLVDFDTGSLPPGTTTETRTPEIVLDVNRDFKLWAEHKRHKYVRAGLYTKYVAVVLSLAFDTRGNSSEIESLAQHIIATESLIIRNWVNSTSLENDNYVDEAVALGHLEERSEYIKVDSLLRYLGGVNVTHSRDDVVRLRNNVVSFLNGVLNATSKDRLFMYLAWEATRQVSSFFIPRLNHVTLKRHCYRTVLKFLGPTAATVPLALSSVNETSITNARWMFAELKKASAVAIVKAGFRNADEEKRFTVLNTRLSNVTINLSYPEDITDMSTLDDKLAYFPRMGPIFFENWQKAVQESWTRKRQEAQPWHGSGHTTKRAIRYDSEKNELLVPVEYLLPPLYAVDSYMASNYGTLGTSLSRALWRAVFDLSMYDIGESSRRFLAAYHVKHFYCWGKSVLSFPDVSNEVAGSMLSEAFTNNWKGSPLRDLHADLELLFVSSCLTTCGSRNDHWCNRVLMAQPRYETTFSCNYSAIRNNQFCSID